MIEAIVVGILVVAAGWFLYRRLRQAGRGDSCSCGSCHCNDQEHCDCESHRPDVK